MIPNIDGQIIAIFGIVLAAAEAAVFLAIILAIYREFGSIRPDEVGYPERLIKNMVVPLISIILLCPLVAFALFALSGLAGRSSPRQDLFVYSSDIGSTCLFFSPVTGGGPRLKTANCGLDFAR